MNNKIPCPLGTQCPSKSVKKIPVHGKDTSVYKIHMEMSLRNKKKESHGIDDIKDDVSIHNVMEQSSIFYKNMDYYVEKLVDRHKFSLMNGKFGYYWEDDNQYAEEMSHNIKEFRKELQDKIEDLDEDEIQDDIERLLDMRKNRDNHINKKFCGNYFVKRWI